MAAGRVGLGFGLACRPVVEHGLEPAPGGFEFVAAHEEGEFAVYRVEQQALISVGTAFGEDFEQV